MVTVMKKRVNVCGICHKKGHNRRTCSAGVHAKPVPPPAPLRSAAPPVSPVSGGQFRLPTFTGTESGTNGSESTPETAGGTESLSYEEVKTWFILTNPPSELEMYYAQKIADHMVAFFGMVPDETVEQHCLTLLDDYRARYSSYPVEAIVAESSVVKICALEQISEKKNLDFDTAIALAENVRSSDKVLWRLVRTGYAAVRQEVARHPYASAEILGYLADSSNVAVRESVARHPNTSADTLRKIVRQPGDRVRALAAERLRNLGGTV